MNTGATALIAEEVLALARASIRHGARFHAPLPAPAHPAGPLAQPGACFVSLHLDHDLRGCIGQLEPTRPLAGQIVDMAYAAAFRDPRFPPVTPAELERLTLEVHVLSPLEPLRFGSLAELRALLRPGVDGLQLEQGPRRGVFLPVMWAQLPTRDEFVAQLLRKAGIAEATGLAASRFTAQVFADAAG